MPKKDFFLGKLNVIVTLKKTFMDYKGWIIYTIIEFVSPRVILISKKQLEKQSFLQLMIHKQNVIKHAKSKKTGPSDKERTFTCLGCYAVNPWTRTLSIWQKISLHGGGDIRFMGSPFILCHPAGLRIGLISSKYWFSQKINSQNLCTEFTSSNNFINNVIGADNC